MANIKARAKLRTGTLAAWTSANPILLAGEPGFESDTNRLRIGDGVNNYLALPFLETTNGALLAGLTASIAELNTLDGITATVTELNYTDGVTAPIQTQLNALTSGKQAAGATLTSLEGLSLVAGDILYATAPDTLVRLPKGTAGQTLVMNPGETAPEWANAAPNSVLLGTLTTTSGTTHTLSGLDLTPYKFVRLVFNGVSTNINGDVLVAGSNVGTLSSAATLGRGIVDFDLANGIFGGTMQGVSFGSHSITTATTSITVSMSANSFDAGSVRFYGIK